MAKKRRGTGDQQLASAEEHAVKSESLFEAKQYADAALEAEKALQCLPLMARSSLTRGRALLYPALSKMVQEGGLPPAGLLEEAGRHFTLAVRLDPKCEEAKGEVDSLQKLLADIPWSPEPPSSRPYHCSRVIFSRPATDISWLLPRPSVCRCVSFSRPSTDVSWLLSRRSVCNCVSFSRPSNDVSWLLSRVSFLF